MSSSSLFILKSKNNDFFKRRLALTDQPKSVSVPTESGEFEKIHLKMTNGKPSWSKDGAKFLIGFQKAPVKINKVVYPQTLIPALSAKVSKQEITSVHYFIIEKNSGRILSSKNYKEERTFKDKDYYKEFNLTFNPKIHKLEMRPLTKDFALEIEQDLFGNDYLEVIQDKKIKVLLGTLLSFWFLMHTYNFVSSFFKKEVTQIQVENKEKILKERKEIAKLLNLTIPEPTTVTKVNDNKPLKSKGAVKRKSKKKKAYSVKKNTPKKLKKGKNTVAATKKTLKKVKAKPSLQDQLFSRSLVKGSTGKASSKAAKTLRGSSRGKKSGSSYGGAGTIKGGFVKGTGSSFGTKLGNRGGTGGGKYKTGGSGLGGLGAGLSLNGTGAGVSGGLTREQINKVVKRNKKDIFRCFETREQFSPGMSGKVAMNFTINGAGRVSSASAGASTINDAALKNCLKRKINTWKFDKPTGGRTVKVSYPFNFKSTQGKF